MSQHSHREERPVLSFSADGTRRRNYTLEQAEFLTEKKAVIAVRSRKGVIVSIHFYGESRLPLQSRFTTGTRYSYKRRYADRPVWELKMLPYQAALFSGVQLSVMSSEA